MPGSSLRRLMHYGPALALIGFLSSCSNDVREVPVKDVRQDGTYVFAILESKGPLDHPSPKLVVPADGRASYSVTPPGAKVPTRRGALEFIRSESNYCIGADKLVLIFPRPHAVPRLVAFSAPVGHYVATETLRASEDPWTQAPTFRLEPGQSVYLGKLTLGPNGDISVETDLTSVSTILPAKVRPITFDRGSSLHEKICTP
jgi:hypothetical protein